MILVETSKREEVLRSLRATSYSFLKKDSVFASDGLDYT